MATEKKKVKGRTSSGKSVDLTGYTKEKQAKTMAYRQGKGRAAVDKKGKTIKGSKDRKHVTQGTEKSGLSRTGSKTAGSGGVRMTRKKNTGDRSVKVVKEAKANRIKSKGIKSGAKGPKAGKHLGKSKSGKLEHKNRAKTKSVSAIKSRGAYGAKPSTERKA